MHIYDTAACRYEICTEFRRTPPLFIIHMYSNSDYLIQIIKTDIKIGIRAIWWRHILFLKQKYQCLVSNRKTKSYPTWMLQNRGVQIFIWRNQEHLLFLTTSNNTVHASVYGRYMIKPVTHNPDKNHKLQIN